MIQVAHDGKHGICFCFGSDATVNFLLFVGRVAVVQAEIAPVRSVPVLCNAGSFGHNLVVIGLKKLPIVIVFDVKVPFQTGLQTFDGNHSVVCSSLEKDYNLSLDSRLYTASMPVKLCTAMSSLADFVVFVLFFGGCKGNILPLVVELWPKQAKMSTIHPLDVAFVCVHTRTCCTNKWHARIAVRNKELHLFEL